MESCPAVVVMPPCWTWRRRYFGIDPSGLTTEASESVCRIIEPLCHTPSFLTVKSMGDTATDPSRVVRGL